MSKKINVVSLLPANVRQLARPVEGGLDNLSKINELLKDRTIINTARFVLKPGEYKKVVNVEAASWNQPNPRSGMTTAVMVVIEFEDGSLTTLGALRRIDATLKNYGPDPLPVNEEELLDMVIKRGIIVKDNKEVFFPMFDNNTRTPIMDENDPSGTGRKTRKGTTMVWDWASDEAPAGTNGKKK